MRFSLHVGHLRPKKTPRQQREILHKIKRLHPKTLSLHARMRISERLNKAISFTTFLSYIHACINRIMLACHSILNGSAGQVTAGNASVHAGFRRLPASPAGSSSASFLNRPRLLQRPRRNRRRTVLPSGYAMFRGNESAAETVPIRMIFIIFRLFFSWAVRFREIRKKAPFYFSAFRYQFLMPPRSHRYGGTH